MLVYKPRRLKGFDGKKGEKKTKKQENQLAQELAVETNPYRIAKRGFPAFLWFLSKLKISLSKDKGVIRFKVNSFFSQTCLMVYLFSSLIHKFLTTTTS